MSDAVPLSPPPSYEYVSLGPWMVSYVRDTGRAQSWIVHDVRSAVMRFWGDEKDHPVRRVIVDARGVVVLGISAEAETRRRMVGTRETMDVTVTVASDHLNMDGQMQVLVMVDSLREMGGDLT